MPSRPKSSVAKPKRAKKTAAKKSKKTTGRSKSTAARKKAAREESAAAILAAAEAAEAGEPEEEVEEVPLVVEEETPILPDEEVEEAAVEAAEEALPEPAESIDAIMPEGVLLADEVIEELREQNLMAVPFGVMLQWFGEFMRVGNVWMQSMEKIQEQLTAECQARGYKDWRDAYNKRAWRV